MNFGELFIASGGRPLDFGGHQLILTDKIPARLGQRFRVTIESVASAYPQGVGISEQVEVFGEKVRRAVVWDYYSVPPDERSGRRVMLPFAFDVACRSKSGHLSFYNMTEYGGRQEWWHGGSCMWVEPLRNGRRYHCNDFEPDADFDDIVFMVEWGEAEAAAP